MGLLVVVAAAVAAVVIAAWTSLRRPAPEPVAVLRARVVSEDDGRRRRSRLRLAPGSVRLMRVGAQPIDLTGPVERVPSSSRSREPSVLLRMRSTTGAVICLDLPAPSAAATTRVLAGHDLPGIGPWQIRRTGRTWWALALLALAVGWAAFLVPLESDDYDATATVVHNIDSWTCTVTWVDLDAVAQRDETDCFGEPVGSTLEIVVPREDFRGAVTTRPMLALVAAVGASLLLTAGGLRLAVVARRQRTRSALLRLLGAAPARPADAGSSARADGRTTRALARSSWGAWGISVVGVLALGAAIVLASIIDEADRELRTVGETTTGVITELHPDGEWSRGGADVRFTAADQEATRYVDLGGFADDYDEGETVDVLYDPSAPDRFAIDDVPYDPPWSVWPMIAALGGTFVVLPLGLRRLWRDARTRRLLSRGVWEPVQVRARWDDNAWWLSTPEGSVWRASTHADWPEPAPSYDAAGHLDLKQPHLQNVWWVRDGEHAVFSPDRGAPIMSAQLR